MGSSRRKASQAGAVTRLTHPSKRGLIGGLYSAKLLFEFCVFVSGKPGDRRLCEERLILVSAPSAREALREAARQGKASAYRYRNSDGNRIHFRFVGVVDLCHLGSECQLNEVWYAIGVRLRPMERRKTLVPKPEKLSAIRNEKLVTGGK